MIAENINEKEWLE